MPNQIRQRIKVIALATLFFFPWIIARLFYVQVMEHPFYTIEATHNLEKYQAITPMRGAILDRHGEILVKTCPQYHLILQPAKLKEDVPKNLSELVSMPLSEIQEEIAGCLARYNHEIDQKMATALQIPFDQYEKYTKFCHDDPQKVAQYLQQHHKISKKRFLKLYSPLRHDYYNRPYPMFKVSKTVAMKLILQKQSWEKDKPLNANIQDRFAGFDISITSGREYPKESMLAHVLGTVGIADKGQIDKDYSIDEIIGRQGLELIFQDKLCGRRGCSVNSRQGLNFTEYPMDGMDLVLTIDAKSQEIAEKALDSMMTSVSTATGGSAVVIDVTTGEIIILASSPRYSLATYSRDYDTLVGDLQKCPLDNRATKSRYPPSPGSVFKIMIAAYVLSHNVTDETELISCRGYYRQPGKFRCTHRHGTVDIVKAIEGSCNIYFYTMGERMGPDMLEECAQLFGFGEKCGIEIDEYPGKIPISDSKKKKEPWGAGDSRMMGIGQRITVTPLQVARAMAMVANRGVMPNVHLIREFRSPNSYNEHLKPGTNEERSLVAFRKGARRWSISDKYWDIIHLGMLRVIEGEYGTAKNLKRDLQGIRIASKTGTAQVGKLKTDHAWFAGFAPFDSPKYAFAVFVEHGGYGGTTAGPIAVEIIKYLLTTP